MSRIGLLFLFILFLSYTAFPQVSKDSSQSVPKGKNPKTASLLAAFLPGAGQIYNGKYWKLPILYGGGFALGYYIRLNNQQYKICRDSYLQVKAGEKDYFNGAYDADQLARLREYWRRNRDLLVIVSGLTYLLNIADAAVDAHLSRFDVSDDLSLRWSPGLMFAGTKPTPTIGICLEIH
jgi:hypothetical protein